MGNFTKFLSEKIVNGNTLISSSLNLMHCFFPIISKKFKIFGKKKPLHNFSSISERIIVKKGVGATKNQQKIDLSHLPFFLFFFRFYNIFFTKRKKSFVRFKKTIEFSFFINFLKKLDKKLNLKNKSKLLTGEETLTYLNRISKFHFRQSIDKIQKKNHDAKFGLFKEKMTHSGIVQRTVKKEKNLFFLGRVSNQRLSKLKILYRILKKKKSIDFFEGTYLGIVPVFNFWFWNQNLSDIFPIFTDFSIQKYIKKKAFFSSKGFFKPNHVLKSLDRSKNIGKKKKRIPGTQGLKIFFYYWIGSEINTIHTLSLLLVFFLKKLDFLNGNDENRNFFFRKARKSNINIIPIKEYILNSGKIFQQSNFNKVDKNIRLFLEKFKTSYLTWKTFILFLRTKKTNLVFRGELFRVIHKLRNSVQKLRKAHILKKKIKSELDKCLKIYKTTSIRIGLLVSKFLASQRLFMYQNLLIKELYLNTTQQNECKVVESIPGYITTRSLKIMRRKVENFKKKLYFNNFNEDSGVIRALKKKINCSVINTLQKEVVLTNCGHLFSSKCIKNLNFSRNRSCPICGKKFSKGSIRPIFFC